MKKYTATLLAILNLLAFTACRSEVETSADSETLTTEVVTTILETTAVNESSTATTISSTTSTTESTSVSFVATTVPSTASTTTQIAQTAAATTTQRAVTTTKKVTTTKPHETTTTLPAFDINYWINFAKDYAVSIGLKLDKGTIGTWDTPLAAGPTLKYTERDIKSSMEWYKREGYTAVWVWAEKRPNSDKYDVYISRG